MRKTKEQKAITLIALVITIVVLLILAAVAISSIINDGVLSYAENGATKYNQAVKNEQDTLQGYVDWLNKHTGGSGSGSTGEEGTGTEDDTEILKTVADIQNEIQASNIKVVDEYGNQIVVPAGFKIRVDEGERTKGDEKSLATNVTQGIVIEDEAGNQFVWVPVGKIYTTADETIKEATAKIITLGRYNYEDYRYYNVELGKYVSVKEINDYIPDENGVYTPSSEIKLKLSSAPTDGDGVPLYEYYVVADVEYIEETKTDTGLGKYGNAIARNIEDFIASSNQNKGYYIGRFEAGEENGALVCKAGQKVYDCSVNQLDSSEFCKKMYNNGEDGYKKGTFSSDLINSYAWDTAIIFIQTFGGTEAKEYYYENVGWEYWDYSYAPKLAGESKDEFCNINDMSSNVVEYSTETCGYEINADWHEEKHQVVRGGLGDRGRRG